MQNLLALLTRFRKRVVPRSRCLISRQSSQCLTPTPVAVFQPLAIRISLALYDNTRIFAIVSQVRQSIIPIGKERALMTRICTSVHSKVQGFSGHFRVKCLIRCCTFCFLNMNFIDAMKLRYLES